jgi:glycosyltransferase involved in cell wall biosynthesis
MRIVIDLQGSQSAGSGNRGIGRYTRALAQAMLQQSRGHEFVFATNGRLDGPTGDAKLPFEDLVPRQNFKTWYPPAEHWAMSAGSQRGIEKLYEAFLTSLRPDVVHIGSLFEGFGEPAVTSIGSFSPTATSVTLYDLIPYIHGNHYFSNPAFHAWYMHKLASLRRADLWMAISEASRQEGIDQLGLNAERCINVSTAADAHFTRLAIDPARELALRSRYGLVKPFVMYTGGIDHRKNIDGLVRAFALLPPELRNNYQLAVVCSANAADKKGLLRLAYSQGIPEGNLVLTGFVPEDDLVALYNLCRLFVFPSWHEGFGLPALEAMNCGAPVIAANSSSLPEVIGRADALFDPRNDASIAQKMSQALVDEGFSRSLVDHGLDQAMKFSWAESGRKALDGLEYLHALKQPPKVQVVNFRGLRPRLAYLSPLRPERSGIAGYSTELLPYLSQYYDIDLITPLSQLDDPTLSSSFSLRSIDWFRQNAGMFDRVLYHFGNSDFHQHMFDLLEQFPGTVVLHDFFLSGVQAHREILGGEPNAWTRALYAGHGYESVAERFLTEDCGEVIFKYPCSFDVLHQAHGVIVHSQHSISLAKQWYSQHPVEEWALIPLLRTPPSHAPETRTEARTKLGLLQDDFLVCAFGLLGPTKLNHRLIDAWLASPLADDPRCKLVFVGENDAGTYGAKISRTIDESIHRSPIEVTGWVSTDMFRLYLAAADAAVQLRTKSRGETSAATLDTMGHGIPTIVNANGSMAYLPDDAVVMLEDEFSDAALTEALERLWRDPVLRGSIGQEARNVVATHHSPLACAAAYAQAIERFALHAAKGRDGLIESVAIFDLPSSAPPASEIAAIAEAVADSLPMGCSQPQLLLDISELVQRDAGTGIQRVVKSLLAELIQSPPDGFRIEPVYASADGPLGYRYARQFTLKFLGCPTHALQDEWVNASSGDIFVGLDLQPAIVSKQAGFYRKLRRMGVRVEFVVYDLLPVTLPDYFHPGALEGHERWLNVVAENDGALCISGAVGNELTTWMSSKASDRLAAGFSVRSFHLGADFGEAVSTLSPLGLDGALRSAIAAQPSFLMVGTLEPRKQHSQVLEAFEKLWARGVHAALVVVGKQGWMVEALIERLQSHPELGKRLFWIRQADDQQLLEIYAASACLIAASEGEGFGLPLIEAARHRLPILARDIPVFREVAGNHAHYFSGEAADLAEALSRWLDLYATNNHPVSDGVCCLTWAESAREFKAALAGKCGTVEARQR